ncbi:MAG: MBL fold metallo-hydrolase [Actinobacteria bacterium]|nr:MBL fold metallo-hydrolase [Actinomycetota bacterium]
MTDLIDLADRLWRGEASIEDHHPFSMGADLVEVAPRAAFVASFGNSVALSADDGLTLVDTGSPFTARMIRDSIRTWSKAPVRRILYTHGHIDHVSGAALFEEEGPLKVIAHENVGRRFDRYRLTAGYNAVINQRQFQVPGLRWPTDYRYPDETYDGTMTTSDGGLQLKLHHARGETDDHTWTWVPDSKILLTGDLFIWTAPNAGNPQKVQRYAHEWSQALREMAKLGAEVMLPGHGLPVIGRDRIRQTLDETAEFLESLVEQTLEMMNSGASLEEIVRSVIPPAHLADRPYLRPIYDEPGFIVRNIWRLYGGWYEGDPSRLKPAARRDLATEIVSLSGGLEKIISRAASLAKEGRLDVACELIEFGILVAPDNPDLHRVRASIYERRAGAEASTMSKGIFTWAASESRSRSEPPGTRAGA